MKQPVFQGKSRTPGFFRGSPILGIKVDAIKCCWISPIIVHCLSWCHIVTLVSIIQNLHWTQNFLFGRKAAEKKQRNKRRFTLNFGCGILTSNTTNKSQTFLFARGWHIQIIRYKAALPTGLVILFWRLTAKICQKSIPGWWWNFKLFWEFSPRKLENITPFWRADFSRGLKPPTWSYWDMLLNKWDFTCSGSQTFDFGHSQQCSVTMNWYATSGRWIVIDMVANMGSWS